MSMEKLIKGLFYHNPKKMEECPLNERVEFVKKNHEDMVICAGCLCFILKANPLCPFCSSYKFLPITEDCLKNLDETSEHIAYTNFLK